MKPCHCKPLQFIFFKTRKPSTFHSAAQAVQSSMAAFAFILCILIVWWSFKVLQDVWWNPRRIERQLKKQGIYGPPYRFIHGNLQEMMKLAKAPGSKPMGLHHDIMPKINPFLHNLLTTYKEKPFVFWYGTVPRVVITDPVLIREILNTKSDSIRKIEMNAFTKLFISGVATYNGDKWAKHRKIITPAFHMEKLKLMMSAFSACCDEMIEKWGKLVQFMGPSEVDVKAEFQNLTADVISRVAFGSNYQEGMLVFLLQKEQGQLSLRSALAHVFPFLRFLPTKTNGRMKEIHKLVTDKLREVVARREKALRSGETGKEDLLGLMLKANLNEVKESGHERGAGMSMEDLIEECKLFYFAGHETTANLLSWTLIALSMHPHWQEQAREEVLQVLGNTKPSFDDLNNLKTVTMILLEVLRLYPPTSIQRCIHREMKLGDMVLPAGTQVMIPSVAVHRDKHKWGKDAMEFNPSRFSKGVSMATNGEVCYFPFGWGPRICIGQNLAMIEAKLVLSQILQHFTFQLSPSYSHAPSASITVEPQFGAHLILNKL